MFVMHVKFRWCEISITTEKGCVKSHAENNHSLTVAPMICHSSTSPGQAAYDDIRSGSYIFCHGARLNPYPANVKNVVSS